MSRKADLAERPAIDQVEEAIALVRRCPVTILALYYLGTLPFVLTFLFYFAEMSHGAYAREHLVESSFLTALAFVWCKLCQAMFGSHLLALAGRRKLPPWSLGKLLRITLAQASLQWSGLFVLPIAALITIPFAYAFAFYQNCAALALNAAGEPLESKVLRQEALAHARRWARQNHYGLAILFAFGLVVFLNLLIAIFLLPHLLKSFFGIETMFTRSLWSVFNTTLFTSAFGLTYLCVDPMIKAFYAMRCFHARSLLTGEDLHVELRTASAPSPSSSSTMATPSARPLVAAVCVLLFLGAGPAPASAAMSAAPGSSQTAPAAPPAEIDRSLSEVLGRPEFAWREMRTETPREERGWFGNWLHDTAAMVKRWLRPAGHMFNKLGEWIGSFFKSKLAQDQDIQSRGGGFDWGQSLQLFAWGFSALALIILLITGWRIWRRRVPRVVVSAEPIPAVPDLAAEDIAADQLPEDGWLSLAREMLARGEPRLAVRALYLAALANLGERQFISIARYKSNYEYQRELRRRRPGQPELQATFSSTIATFERAWYGMHEVTSETLAATESNLQRIRQG